MLNKIFSSILIASIVLSLIIVNTGFAAASNLITNPGFENGLTGWTNSRAAASVINPTTTSIVKNSGTYSGVISSRTANYESLRQVINVKKDRTYTYSVYVKLGSASDGVVLKNTSNVDVPVGDDADQNFYIYSETVPSGSYPVISANVLCNKNTWTLITADYKFIDSDKTLKVFVNGSGTPVATTVYTDDFKVEPKFYAQSVSINGGNNLYKPAAGSTAKANYTATILNQNGNNTEMSAVPVVWSIDGTPVGISVDSQTGEVTLGDNISVSSFKLIATATDYSGTFTSEKIINLQEYTPDATIVEQAISELNISSESLDQITSNLNLTNNNANVNVVWSSSNTSVVSNAGVVTRSVDADAQVTLTATVSRNTVSKTKTFELSVLQLNELIKNGGFETGAFASDWYKGGTGTIGIESTEKHGGNYSAKMFGRTGTADSLRQDIQNITVKNNRTYVYSAWLKSGAGALDKGFRLYCEPQYAILASLQTISSTRWTQLKGEYQFTNNLVPVKLFAFENGATDIVNTLYMDDYSVTPKYVAKTATISGSNAMILPQTGNKTISYTANVYNQIGTTAEMNTVPLTWKIVDNQTNLPVDGVSVDQTGVVTISSTVAPTTLKLTAVASDYGSKAKVEKVISLEAYVDDATLAQRAVDKLSRTDITTENLSAITKNLILPSTGDYGSTITWTSSNTSVVSNSGTVTRPTTGFQNVVLTATLTVNTTSLTKTFDLKVRKPDNFLKNGDFETGVSSPWTLKTDTGAPTAITIIDTDKYSGNYALKITGRTQSYMSFAQSVTLQYNKTYQVTAYVKLASPFANARPSIVSEYGTAKEFIALASMPANTYLSDTVWTKITANYTHNKSDGQASNVFIYGAANADLLVDDFSITEVGTEPFSYDVSYYNNLGTNLLTTPITGATRSEVYINAGSANVNTSMVVASYDSNGKLIDTKIVIETVALKTGKSIQGVVNSVAGGYIKVMLLNTMNNLKPLLNTPVTKFN